MFQKYPEIEINLNPIHDRKKHTDKETGESQYIYSNNDDISGEVLIRPRHTPFEHTGIHLELIGIISIRI